MSRRSPSCVKGRARRQRLARERVLIVCESGETEPNYLNALKRVDAVENRFVVHVMPGRGDPVKTTRRAIQRIERLNHEADRYEHKWCVFDVETPDRHDLLREACILASRHGFKLCLSNPAFEIWYVLHFEIITKSFANARSLRSHLQKRWKENFGQRYDKSGTDHFQRLASQMRTAIDNAKWGREQSPDHGCKADTIDCNAATDVYKLVELLTNPPRPS